MTDLHDPDDDLYAFRRLTEFLSAGPQPIRAIADDLLAHRVLRRRKQPHRIRRPAYNIVAYAARHGLLERVGSGSGSLWRLSGADPETIYAKIRACKARLQATWARHDAIRALPTYVAPWRASSPDLGCQPGDRFTYMRRSFTCVEVREHDYGFGAKEWLADWATECAAPGCGATFVQSVESAFPFVHRNGLTVRCPAHRPRGVMPVLKMKNHRTIAALDTPDMGCQVGDQFTHMYHTFKCVGHRPHVTKDGRETYLAEWQSTCANSDCARSFVATTRLMFPREPSAWLRMVCEACRTPPQIDVPPPA